MNKLKVISLTSIIIILTSCSSNNVEKYQHRKIPFLINDYILEYSIMTENESLFSVFLRKENNSIIIKDVPKTAALGYLKEIKINTLNAVMISKILCLYYEDEISLNEEVFIAVPSELWKEAEEKTKIVIGGEEYLISNELTEWHPTLEIIYSLERKEKTVKNLVDDTKRIIKFDNQ